LGGSERRFEPPELGAMVSLELAELPGERTHDVALRRRMYVLRLFVGGRRLLLVGAELLDPATER
jgi:hypothetical protein